MDNTARVWEAATGQARGTPLLDQHPVRRVAFSPDGRTVCLSYWNQRSRLWDLPSGKPLGPPLSHAATPQAVLFRAEGRKIAIAAEDGHVQVWDVPEVLRGEVASIVLWGQVITGMELDAAGGVRLLDSSTWHQRRRQLAELGPDWVAKELAIDEGEDE
jgi:WD40 repeat protein